MDITVYPQKLQGNINAIPSKSQAHRLLICSAFSDKKTTLYCPETNNDIEATAACLRSIGADIERTQDGYSVQPIKTVPASATLPCGESGSTLRFMLPIVGALGIDTTFLMEGRLPKRPLSPLWEEMERHGCVLTRPTGTTIRCIGKLNAGNYSIDGSISSQFITGLLFAISLISGKSKITVTGKLESTPYIEMTQNALKIFGVHTENFVVNEYQQFISPGHITVEGDWSNGAFFLAANQLGSKIHVDGLDYSSPQGDKAVAAILDNICNNITVDASDIPDLVPILSIAGGANKGISFNNIKRLRLKESDRVATVCSMLERLGATVESTANTLRVYPAKYHSCIIDAAGDHRIAMAAAIAATAADGPVIIRGAQCVSKSYPSFWEDFGRVGGKYEQHIR